LSPTYFDNLAGVRGLAAAVVLVSHVVQLHFLRFTGLGTPLHQISSFVSEYAVVVFFILSGYLITHTLEINVERNRRLRLDLFAVARIARLYPPLIFSILLSVAIFLVMDVFGLPGRSGPLSLPGDIYAAREVVHLRVLEIGGAMIMLQGMLEINGPLWSIYIEAKLYALFAIALAFFTGRKSLVFAIAFFLIAWAGIKYNPGFARYAVVWLTGALAYYAWNECNGRRNRLLLCSSLIAVVILADTASSLQTGGAWLIVRDLFVAIVIAWILFRLRLRVPVSKRLADCSYSLYATHFPVLLLAQSLLLSSGSSSVALAVGVAMVSTLAALGVALVGGRIEAKKSLVQEWLLMSILRLRREMGGTS
jgi:peptidoglycan/LPS O-acetylase OafA/YrhL